MFFWLGYLLHQKPFLDRIKLENEMRSSYSSYPATTRITTVHAEPNELILLFGFPILKQQKLQLKLRNPGTPYTSHWAESRNCGVNAHQIRIILRDLSSLEFLTISPSKRNYVQGNSKLSIRSSFGPLSISSNFSRAQYQYCFDQRLKRCPLI